MTSRSPKRRSKGGAHPSYYSPLLDGSQVARSGQPGPMHGEPSPEGPASDGDELAEQRHREGIQHEMHAASRDYVAGRITSKKHDEIHARGRKVLREMRK